MAPRRQAAAAVSGDGKSWYLINATPDVTVQLGRWSELHPAEGVRHTPLKGVLLTDGELDHTLGLLHLREGTGWTLYATAAVARMLRDSFPVASLLRRYADTPLYEANLDEPLLLDPDSEPFQIRWLETGQDQPLYSGSAEKVAGAVAALVIQHVTSGRSVVYAPGVSTLTTALHEAIAAAEAVWFDGTFWTPDEMQQLTGAGRSAWDMGHVPMAGPEGSAQWLAKLPVKHRRFIHINNTNPVLDPTSEQRKQIRELGLDLAEDGDVWKL